MDLVIINTNYGILIVVILLLQPKKMSKKNDLETIGLAEELTESKNVEEVDTASFDIGIDNLVGFC